MDMVASLIDYDARCWKCVLAQVFAFANVKHIIPLFVHHDDMMVWNASYNGAYTTISRYSFIIDYKESNYHSTSVAICLVAGGFFGRLKSPLNNELCMEGV